MVIGDLLCVALLGALVQDAAVPVEAAFDVGGALDLFWAAPDVGARDAIAAEIVASGAAFDDVLDRLRVGRTYAADVPRGRLVRSRAGLTGYRMPYLILVPKDYDPEKRWPVRVDLHGGMGAPEWKDGDGSWSPNWREAQGQIVVVPAGWWDAMWWEWSQVESLEAILREVRSTWNIDENRVVMFGSSDGGAALFFHAMRQPDRFSGFCGTVAPPDRLTRADFRPDGQMHVSNLSGQRFHLAYGERDRKVPLRYLKRYIELFIAAGALIDWYVLPKQGHSLQLPEEKERALGKFLWRTVRDPLPDRVEWSTERTDRYARRAWVVIDALSEPAVRDDDAILPRWGTPIQMHGETARREEFGTVIAEREGNTASIQAPGVARFTLLLSPREFDLQQPIVVRVDGKTVHDAVVKPSVATLLHWAARDDDRERLFAASLTIDL